MDRKYDHDAAIIYVDSHGTRHTAFVTAWWNCRTKAEDAFGTPPHQCVGEAQGGVNLVFVSKDGAKQDPYGRQIERATSVVHKTSQPAHANYWMWPDEA